MLRRGCFDWKNLILMKESGSILEFTYPLAPKSFLKIAKEDFRDRSERGLVNALSNAKRAIDCQTDTFLSAIGFSPKDIQKQLGNAVIAGLKQFVSNPGQPLKFQVLESLGIVTPAIVSRVRRIRNLLEHQYKMAAAAAVRDAIDVASLYLSACEGSMNTFLENVHFQAGDTVEVMKGYEDYDRSFSVGLDWRGTQLKVEYWNRNKGERAEKILKPRDVTYLAWLRVLFAVRAEDLMEEAISAAASIAATRCNQPISRLQKSSSVKVVD